MSARLRIPADLHFADLALELRGNGGLLFLPAPLGKMCLSNGLDPELVLADEDWSCWLITGWYLVHRQAGGEPDPAAEEAMRRVAENPFVVPGET